MYPCSGRGPPNSLASVHSPNLHPSNMHGHLLPLEIGAATSALVSAVLHFVSITHCRDDLLRLIHLKSLHAVVEFHLLDGVPDTEAEAGDGKSGAAIIPSFASL